MNQKQINHSVHSFAWFVYTNALVDKEYVQTYSDEWDAVVDLDKIKLPEDFKPLLWQQEKREHNIVFASNDLLAYLSIEQETVRIRLASNEPDKFHNTVEYFKKILVPLPDLESGKIRVRFWYNTNNGPTYMSRVIDAPVWETVRENYNSTTGPVLDKLMNHFRPSKGGQLVLWAGDPGGGKTFALRALCDAWRSWCTIDFITDPENFFGLPNYLMQILSAQGEGEEIEFDDTGKAIILPNKKQEKWKLLILEDSGEFLTPDARAKTGQALSRLLNVADGFIGQGLKIIMLITTNEEIGKLHPAVSRPGRSAAVVPFTKLSFDEASEWARNHGMEPLKNLKEYSVAELYAILNKSENKVEEKKKEFGFARISAGS